MMTLNYMSVPVEPKHLFRRSGSGIPKAGLMALFTFGFWAISTMVASMETWARTADSAPSPGSNLLSWLFLNPPEKIPGVYRPPIVMKDQVGYWNGVQDRVLLDRIQKAQIERITVNLGGSSLSLRLHLANGDSAAFKPEQVHIQTVPRKELGAYAVNRMLGLARVPPATFRIMPEKLFYQKLKSSYWWRKRIRKEMRPRKDGMLTGEVSFWIPKIRCLKLERWRYRKKWHQWLKAYKSLTKRHFRLATQISAMLVFDFVINNADRFSGCNVLSTHDGNHIYFMDNTMSFFLDRQGCTEARRGLHRTQRFSRRVYKALVDFSERRLRQELARLGSAPWPILTDEEISMVMKRRAYALWYIHQVIARYGWEKVMVFP